MMLQLCLSFQPAFMNRLYNVTTMSLVHDTKGLTKHSYRLRQEAYAINMASDVYQHCHNCVQCQRSKLLAPARAPMTSIPIGTPWQIIAVDILEVPVSYHNNRYLLVVQDYFTYWAEAIQLPDHADSNTYQLRTCEDLLDHRHTRHPPL